MGKRIGSVRRKTRSLYKKNYRQKGKFSLVRYFQKFNLGDKVILAAESGVHEGMYYRRFHGKVGTVVGSRGKCFQVTIRDGNKEKQLLVHPVHLQKIEKGE